MGQSSLHDADTEISIVATIVGPKDTNEEEESSSKLSLVLSELEKSSCQVHRSEALENRRILCCSCGT